MHRAKTQFSNLQVKAYPSKNSEHFQPFGSMDLKQSVNQPYFESKGKMETIVKAIGDHRVDEKRKILQRNLLNKLKSKNIGTNAVEI